MQSLSSERYIDLHQILGFYFFDVERYEKLKQQHDAIDMELQRRKEQYDLMGAFIATMENNAALPLEFDADLWLATVEKVTVHTDYTVTFTSKGGMEIAEEM